MKTMIERPMIGDVHGFSRVHRSSGPAVARKPRWARDAIRSLIREVQKREPAEGAEDRVLEILGTDETPDRYNTVLMADGWMLDRYRQNPVFLWCHDDTSPPIGLTLDIRAVNENGRKGLVFLVLFADAEASPLADRVFRLFQGGFMNATSVGFWPHETREIEDEDEARDLGLAWPYLTSPKFPPIVHERNELLELSAVPVPGNPNALVQRAMTAGWIKAEEAHEVERMLSSHLAVKNMLVPITWIAPGLEPGVATVESRAYRDVAVKTEDWNNLRRASSLITRVLANGKPGDDEPEQDEPEDEPTELGAMSGPRAYRRRMNPALPRNFDVARESLQPATVMCAWASKYLGCEVKDIHLQRFSVPMARIGGFLSGLRHATSELSLKAARNILENGTEMPPVRSEIQLNSKMSDSFLIDGAEFFEDKTDRAKFIVAREPCWCCLEFTVMARAEHSDRARAIQDGAWAWLRGNDPLKGEAFSITGEFQKRGDLTLDDVFGTERNTTACTRALAALNNRGAAMPSRGVIMMGPPGTGKTMSLRAIRDQAHATFLWVSAKDLRWFGGCTGIEVAFEYARELAPSVIAFEDIDSWIGDSSIDLLKVEMDGVAKTAGLLTILTTNYPERLPDALIDRPGRFHDVLNFDLPDESVRGAMLAKWIPGLDAEQLAFAVESTAGMSGAHVRYVADFVASIVEAEGLAVGDALVRAVETIREQRELVKGLRGWSPIAIETSYGTADSAANSQVLPEFSQTLKLDPPEVSGRAMEETDMTLKEMLTACAAVCDKCSAACKAGAENETDETKAAALEACVACKAACAECAAMIEAGMKPEMDVEPDEEAAVKAMLDEVTRKLDAVAA